MKYIKSISVLIFSLMMICRITAVQAQECCPSPPACVPTMACPLEMSAGQTEATTNKVIQTVSTAYEKVTSAIRTVKKKVSQARRAMTSAVDSVTDGLKSVIMYPFKKVGQWTGLTKAENEEDTEGVTQDNSHGDLSVEERMERNLLTYADESKADYASEYFTVERRKYIRQQATITLMARMLVMKAHFKDIKEVMDGIEKRVKDDEEKGSKSDGEGNMTTASNETVILGSNLELRLAWFQLLTYQKMIEAVKLEFAANQAISGMKLVKHVPSVSSSGKGDGKVDVKTKSNASK